MQILAKIEKKTVIVLKKKKMYVYKIWWSWTPYFLSLTYKVLGLIIAIFKTNESVNVNFGLVGEARQL